MRYLLASLIAVVTITLDFGRDTLDRSIWTESFAQVADFQPKTSTERVGSEGEDLEKSIDTNESAVLTKDDAANEDNQSLGKAAAPISMSRVCEAIKEAAEDSGIPVGFFARLLWQESNFRSKEVSSAGARGIAQFMPQTAAEVGLNDPFDPLQAIPASARFLRRLHNQFGNLGLAAAAYNAGGGRIEKWLSRRGPLPQETRAYVKIITGNKAEDWATESKIVSLPTDLPRGAKCDGIEGLSKSKYNQFAEIPVKLTPTVSEILRKAEDDDVKARRRATRFILKAVSVARARMPPMAGAKSNSARTALLARTHRAHGFAKNPMVRLASASGR